GHHATFPAPTHRGRSGRLHPYRDSPVTSDDGAVTGMVALEDLVEDLVGTLSDGKHRN
ncbi:hypothetical protein OSH93_22060, partial [Mycobacterium ulcerans]|nr:hypothetical protein [Mycobacterium ulcerans]MEB4415537.1 hypothetical protein [Mycobacterium ulcerans]MEB4433821.1 hypothetical protein [Mycobacterium ulcerans]